MFERYTEKARRAIFFARYEASQYGSPAIETEHLLLGLLREDFSLAKRFLTGPAATESIRKQIERTLPVHDKIPTSIDLPLANPCRRALDYAAEEAERLANLHIGTEHLLLGLLREKDCLAAKLLTERGLRADTFRVALSEQPHESPADIPASPHAMHALAGGVQVPHTDPLVLRRKAYLLRSIRIWLTVVIVGLVISGVTAFPLLHETALLVRAATSLSLSLNIHAPAINAWLVRVASALADTNARYPFLAYGTDWLAFAHLVIAAAFIGPWLDPVRNKWVIAWGFLCCAGVLPLALIAGPLRGIPLYWRLIDCSFGVFCCLALLVLHRRIAQLEALSPYRS